MTLSVAPSVINEAINNITCSISPLEITTAIIPAVASSAKTKTTKTASVGKVKKKTNAKLIAKEATEVVPPPNVILHLKCSLKDLEQYNYERQRIVKDPLQYNPEVPPEIKAYEEPDVFSSTLFGSAFVSTESENAEKTKEPFPPFGLAYPQMICQKCRDPLNTSPVENSSEKDKTREPDFNKTQMKIKELKIQFYSNEVETAKKSACMWCSYDFENEPFYLPRQETSSHFIVYGCFCSPECATGYLFKERIDDTAKFERYHLLNKIYSSSCPDNENIHPAPNPHLLLEKFLGNLTIQEYRGLSKRGQTFDVVEKPLSRVLPELHADMNSGGGQSYKVKRSNGTVSA